MLLEHQYLICPSLSLQSRLKTVSLSITPVRVKGVLLRPPMLSNAGIAKQTEGCRLALRAILRPQLALWVGLIGACYEKGRGTVLYA